MCKQNSPISAYEQSYHGYLSANKIAPDHTAPKEAVLPRAICLLSSAGYFPLIS